MAVGAIFFHLPLSKVKETVRTTAATTESKEGKMKIKIKIDEEEIRNNNKRVKEMKNKNETKIQVQRITRLQKNDLRLQKNLTYLTRSCEARPMG